MDRVELRVLRGYASAHLSHVCACVREEPAGMVCSLTWEKNLL
jgi:hypothetical protein